MDWKKIGLFLIIAFGISWATALLMYLADIEYGGMVSMLIVAVLYMPAPAYATLIVQKGIYKDSIKQYGWSISKKTVIYGLLAGLIGALIVPGTLLVSAVLGNAFGISEFGHVDLTEAGVLNAIAELVEQIPSGSGGKLEEFLEEGFPFPTWILLPVVITAGFISAISINLPFMFGEEFGWRGLLLFETRKMGLMKNTLFIGIIWGLWHAPIIAMGHNYPGYPVEGILMMCGLTTAMCIPFAYVRIRGKSILGPCILHGMVNGTASATVLFLVNGHPLFGSIAGISGIIALCLISLVIVLLDRKFYAEYSRT